MISLYNIVESIQELYHFTTVNCLMSIIDEDKFICSVDDYHNDGYPYYMSLTRKRSALDGYPQAMLSSNLVRIIIDADALKSRYKIKSMDYGPAKWHAIKSNWKDKKAFDDNRDEIMKQSGVESEDRAYIKDEVIQDFHKYIKGIHLDASKINKYQYEEIKRYCEKYNINLTTSTHSRFMLGR